MKNLKKELITLIVVIMFVFCLNFYTEKILNETMREMINKIEIIKEDINNENVTELKDIWMEREKKISYFLEHDELEKVTLEIEKLKINTENNLILEAEEDIKLIETLLNHIEEKGKLKMKNIF